MSEERPSVGQSHHRTSGGKAAALSPRLIPLLIVATVLLYGVVYPNLHVVVASLKRDGSWSLANYSQAFSQTIVLDSIFASVGISILTVLACAAVGIPLAFLFERYTFPARRLFAILAALPLVLPPLVGTVAFFHDFNGVLQRASALWRRCARSDSRDLHRAPAGRCDDGFNRNGNFGSDFAERSDLLSALRRNAKVCRCCDEGRDEKTRSNHERQIAGDSYHMRSSLFSNTGFAGSNAGACQLCPRRKLDYPDFPSGLHRRQLLENIFGSVEE